MAGLDPAIQKQSADVCDRSLTSQRAWRGKIHSSHGGRKAYLNFELKDRRRPEAARQSKSDLSDFDIINAHLGNSRDGYASLTSKCRYARVSRAMNGVGRPPLRKPEIFC